MDELPDDPHTLYEATRGRGLRKEVLYVGITNSRSRRFREHRSRSGWMNEADNIQMKHYPDRGSALEAERRRIRDKRPHYNVQHNSQEVEVEGSPFPVAELVAATCAAVLGLRWLADVSSARWMQRQARRRGVSVEVLPPRDPFSEPSIALTLLEASLAAAAGARPGQPLEGLLLGPVSTVQSSEPGPAVETPAPGVPPSVPVAPVGSAAPVGLLVAIMLICAFARPSAAESDDNGRTGPNG
jgi:hypothetical protein